MSSGERGERRTNVRPSFRSAHQARAEKNKGHEEGEGEGGGEGEEGRDSAAPKDPAEHRVKAEEKKQRERSLSPFDMRSFAKEVSWGW